MSTIVYADAKQILAVPGKAVLQTDSVVDIGPGLRPMNFFVPQTHIMIEGFKNYIPLLQRRFSGQPGTVFMHAVAQKALPLLADKSVDSVFMLDVIEHMPRRVAREVLKHCERIARRQIVLETPYGYVKQHYHKDELDGWGFSYNALQNHKSGWDERDFQNGWQLFICREFGFHQQSGDPYGLMYAIRNLEEERERLTGKILFVSAKIPPIKDAQWEFVKDLFRGIDARDAVILTDDVLSAYMVGHFDLVAFGQDRLAPLHLTASGSREVSYADMEKRFSRMELYEIGYAGIARRISHIMDHYGITHLLFTDESQPLYQHLKKFSAERHIPAMCLTSDAALAPGDDGQFLTLAVGQLSPPQMVEKIAGFMKNTRRTND